MRPSLLASLLLVALSAHAACQRSNTAARDTLSGIRLNVDSTAGASTRCFTDSAGVVPRRVDTEPYVAADPRDPNRMLAVWQTHGGGGALIQFAGTQDGGRTWTAPRAVPINACAGGPPGAGRAASDPWATFGPDGRAYLSAIAWTPASGDGPDETSALVVVASPDGGRAWDPPVAAAIAPSRNVAYDNLAITADPTRPGTLYAATTHATEPSEGGGGYYGQLGFTKSVDGGRTWQTMRTITPAVNGERIGAPQIQVDQRTGRLYAVYHRSRSGQANVGVMISEDAGATWSNEAIATPHVRPARVMHPVSGRRFILADDIVQAVVSPVTGELLIAYADARLGGGTPSVSVVRSPDGRRWSAPADVSQIPDAAWLPAIAVSSTGQTAVTYYTSSFERENGAPFMAVMLRHLPSNATDPVTAAANVVAQAPLEWPGDYTSLVASGSAFVAVYGMHSDIHARRLSDDRDDIISASRAFSAAYVRGDVDAMMALYTPDAVILPPGRPILRGTDALRRYWTLPAGVRVVEHASTPDSIVVEGNTAYDWGTYRVRTINAESEERTTLGKYVIVWVRDPRDARLGWRMHVDMWNAGS